MKTLPAQMMMGYPHMSVARQDAVDEFEFVCRAYTPAASLATASNETNRQ
jgi:hypothetical protein